MEKLIGIACDHAGYKLKEKVKAYLQQEGYSVKDFGTNSEESVDYPVFAHQLASKINSGELPRGIVICGTGNGVNMVANKYPHVRSALCWKPEIATLARQHNNANILALPARFIEEDLAMETLKAYLTTDFEGGRHERRVNLIPIQ